MIVDSNMLIEIIKNKVRVEGAITLSPCIEELTRLNVKEAKVALKLIKEKEIPVIHSSLPADEAIIDYAVRKKIPVATNDKELIKRLREKNIRVLRLRQKRYLMEV